MLPPHRAGCDLRSAFSQVGNSHSPDVPTKIFSHSILVSINPLGSEGVLGPWRSFDMP